ncbi:MAG: hypothetical protein WCT53_03110 [Candidatus Gracilibacteria bacterium]
MKKSLIALMLITAFTFSGCTLFQEDGLKPQEPVTDVSGDTVLDNQIFTAAYNALDIKRCDEIKDTAKKEECKVTVSDTLLSNDAFNKLDKSICNKIANARYKDSCIKAIEGKINSDNASIKQDGERLSAEQEAIKKGDANLCDAIKDEGQKNSCRYNVIVHQALQKNDPSLCDKIGDKSFIAICKEGVGSVDK